MEYCYAETGIKKKRELNEWNKSNNLTELNTLINSK